MTINNSSQRTEILYGEENLKNAILQFFSKSDRIDSCGDHKAALVTIEVTSYQKLLFDLKNRGVKLRYIVEVTKENIHYCKEMMKFAEDVRHIDGLKANFSVSETEYIATTAAQQQAGQPLPQVIYSNVKDIVEQQRYIFESFWNSAISADQKIREIEEGVHLGKAEIIQNAYKTKELFINLIKSAADEILLTLPTVNSFYREESIGVIDLVIEAVEKRGTRVKVLIASSEPIEKLMQKSEKGTGEEGEEKQKKLEIRQIDLTSEIKSTILVTDRKAALATELRDDSKESFVEAIGLASYSTSKTTVLSYTSIFENFWKQVELYQQLKEANEQLKVHDRIQKEFIDIAAYELRTPIQPILSLSQSLRSKKRKDSEDDEYLDIIIRNVKRLRQLTEDILDVSRIESHALQVKKERFNLNDLILGTISDSRNQIQSSNADVKLHYEAINDIFVQADRYRISQVILNLLGNAIKFTKEGTVYVSAEQKEDQVIVSIKDTGQGIDPEILPRLFSKFVTTKSFSGTSLGLFISKSIIESHGGKIWAENNKDGKGATFSFSLLIRSSS